MNTTTVPITKRGAEMLKEELHRLKTKDRPAVINAIAEARAQGDLSENAEYDAAKERQAFIEGRIADLEGKLGAAQIIDPALLDAEGRIVFGSTVELDQAQQGLRHLADRARADRQIRRRRRRSAGTVRHSRIRSPRSPLHLIGRFKP
jgi:hypothetical protein